MVESYYEGGPDTAKLILFFLLMIPLCMAGVGLLLLLIVGIGLLVSRSTRDVTHLVQSTRLAQALVIAGALFLFILGLGELDAEEKVWAVFAMAAGMVFAILVFEYLWLQPTVSILEYRFSLVRSEKVAEKNGPNIMGRDSLSSYSTADELLKWKSLLKEGVITEGEFEEAKKKLLSSK